MLKAFEDKAFSMNAGEMSNVFESEQGYHIILVTDRSVIYEPLENVKESIKIRCATTAIIRLYSRRFRRRMCS